VDKATKIELEGVLHKAGQAQAILDNPVWQEVFNEKMDMLFKGFLMVDGQDTETMRDIVSSGKAHTKLKDHFETIALAANTAREIIEEDK
jgi:hypothetical protein